MAGEASRYVIALIDLHVVKRISSDELPTAGVHKADGPLV
jgi:hypothetical protein